MTDLIVVPQAAHWQRLKRLVLDSVSSPITRRVYNLGLDEFFEWYGREPPGRLMRGSEWKAHCGGPPCWLRRLSRTPGTFSITVQAFWTRRLPACEQSG